jgi:hypothetical protein
VKAKEPLSRKGRLGYMFYPFDFVIAAASSAHKMTLKHRVFYVGGTTTLALPSLIWKYMRIGLKSLPLWRQNDQAMCRTSTRGKAVVLN